MLTENPAVLVYIADRAAEGVLAPPANSPARYRMLSWLNFIATELHSTIYHPLFAGDEGAKGFALVEVDKRFRVLSDHLNGRDFLCDTFTVADAYLFVVLNWSETAGVPIADWPVLKAWRSAIKQRPSVASAIAAEAPLLKAAQAATLNQAA